MAHVRPAITTRMTRRMCLSCGHSGRALQGDRGLTTFQCPSCGADLYARPPRSYADLEGLDEALESSYTLSVTCDELTDAEPRQRRRHPGRILERVLIWSVAASVLVVLTGAVVSGL